MSAARGGTPRKAEESWPTAAVPLESPYCSCEVEECGAGSSQRSRAMGGATACALQVLLLQRGAVSATKEMISWSIRQGCIISLCPRAQVLLLQRGALLLRAAPADHPRRRHSAPPTTANRRPLPTTANTCTANRQPLPWTNTATPTLHATANANTLHANTAMGQHCTPATAMGQHTARQPLPTGALQTTRCC